MTRSYTRYAFRCAEDLRGETRLRERFAMAALMGLASRLDDQLGAEDLAERAWQLADAMVKAKPK